MTDESINMTEAGKTYHFANYLRKYVLFRETTWLLEQRTKLNEKHAQFHQATNGIFCVKTVPSIITKNSHIRKSALDPYSRFIHEITLGHLSDFVNFIKIRNIEKKGVKISFRVSPFCDNVLEKTARLQSN